MAQTGKKVSMFFDKIVASAEEQSSMLSLVKSFNPGDADMENSGDVAWQSVEQQAPIIDGVDVTGQATDIIQETVPMALGTPKNDLIIQTAANLRDPQFWDNRAKASGKRQTSELNKRITNLMVNASSMYYNTTAVNGFTAIGEGMVMLDERQKAEDNRKVMLNTTDNFKFAQDLAGRQNFAGRPENAYGKGSLGMEVGDSMVYSGSFLPNIIGNTAADANTTATLSDAPQGGVINGATNTVTNFDYRVSTIAVVSTNYAVGDRVKFTLAGGADVMALGLQDKTNSNRAITATITAIPDGTSIEVYPKIIAQDDPALSVIQAAYANVDTQIVSGTAVVKLNNFTGVRKANLFWCKDAVQITGGNVPFHLLKEFEGLRIINTTMKNGQKMYFGYTGDLLTLNFQFRVFTWYGETMLDPSACGVFTTS